MQKPHETLEKVGLFRSLERKAREGFESRCQWRHAHPKEWLLEQNDIGTDIYFLTSGVVRVLIGDLVTQGYLQVYTTLGESTTNDERRELIGRTLRGLRAL